MGYGARSVAVLSFFVLALSAGAAAPVEVDTSFVPDMPSGHNEKEYRKGKEILKNTYEQIVERDQEITYADYWNVAVAYAYMGVDAGTIRRLLERSKRTNSESFCIIVNHQLGTKNNRLEDVPFYQVLGQGYAELIADCAGIELVATSLEERWAEKEQLDLSGLNEAVIDRLIVLMDKDQRYRFSHEAYGENWEEQTRLDREVQEELAGLFDQYGYPGKSMVGEEYKGYACLLLEHGGELGHQEKYFPLVVEASKRGEVDKPYVRMLVDRVHWKKTGTQVFGSHSGVPFADDAVIADLKKRYDL